MSRWLMSSNATQDNQETSGGGDVTPVKGAFM